MLLHSHTYFSFCYGTLSVEEMLHEVQSNGYTQFVLADINNTSACIDTVRLANERGLKPLLGIDFRNGVSPCYLAIAKNNEGFNELNKHLSRHLHTGENFSPQAPVFHQAYVVYPMACYTGWPLKEHEWLGVSVHELNSFSFFKAKKWWCKMVAFHTLSFVSKKQYNAHRLLRAIDKNTLLSKLAPSEQAPYHPVFSYHQLMQAFAEYPQIILNTNTLLNNCSISFAYGKFANKNLQTFSGSKFSDMELLRAECAKGIAYRYGKTNNEIINRVEKELAVIQQMDFASYFLINWDITAYARRKNYYYVGRGSGANSMVAYLLRITDVDPIALDLYFERFINPFRSTPPDFDIDFSWTDRDDITRYIFDTYGYQRTALLATYSTFQKDAVIRELGKVFGLPAAEIELLQKTEGKTNPDHIAGMILRYSSLLQGFPSHLSIHSSGIIISQEEITNYSATFIPPKGYPTTQFSMLEAEDIGLYKLDILSQRGLGKIKDSLEIIEKNKGIKVDIHNIQKITSDSKTAELLKQGKCIGCFYIESPGMRMLLTKLKAADYIHLVAASSIIRPGVSKSGMMREYILRYRDKEKREQAKKQMPELYSLLQETYGVMVYQEDVIKIGHLFAGLSLAEADYLRRGMSWKFKQRNEFHEVKQKFFDNCLRKNYLPETITEIWTQIESFANFAFSKAHSASYAVESFQALYLKAYYPIEYMVATLNNGGGFYRKEIYLHEARMHGAFIEPPCVNKSTGLCELYGKQLYLGLGLLNEIETDTIYKILRERNKNGLFVSLYDFVKRVPITVEQLRVLIRANAFRFTGKNKRALLWEAHSLVQPAKQRVAVPELFDVKPTTYRLPELHVSELDEAHDEIELLGFPLCPPFLLLKEPPPTTLKAKDLRKHLQQQVEITGYLVAVKSTYTWKKERMYFGTFIDEEGMWIDTVHFPPSVKESPFMGPGCYCIYGKVTEEYDFITLEVIRMRRLPVKNRG